LTDAGSGPVQRLEEAFHLLRRLPRTSLASYYIGTLPFVLAVLYFVQDMSLHTFADQRLAAGSLGLAVLFGWMKIWQSRFAGAMAAFQAGVELPPDDPAARWRQAAHQVFVQPVALLGLLLSALAASVLAPGGRDAEGSATFVLVALAVLMCFEAMALLVRWRVLLPIAGTISFFQNVTLLADGRRPLREALALSARLSRHGDAASAGLPTLALLAGLLWGNLTVLLVFTPTLLQHLLGLDTSFSRGGGAMQNSTLLGIAVALTFLLVDPMVRALHVLRCFYATADRSGQDLRGRFHRARSADTPHNATPGPSRDTSHSPSRVAMILATLLTLSAAGETPAGREGGTPSPQALRELADQLDHHIDDTLADGQYAWRPEQDNPNAGLMESISNTITRWGNDLRDWFRSREKKTAPRSGGGCSSPTTGSGGGGCSGPKNNIELPPGEAIGGGLQLLLYILLVVALAAVVVVIVLFLRHQLRRDDKDDAADDESTTQAKPDLERDDTTADQLPEEGWLGMAADLLAKRQYRLALRAMYLACLAGLAQRELVKIGRSKSNHDYVVELRRRAHATPGLMEPFLENVAAFETAWYGMHDVTESAVRRFRDNQQRMYTLTARPA